MNNGTAKPNPNHYNERYKASVALNNAAVLLLEQDDCYKDAIEMFRVAVYTIQLSFCSLGNYDSSIVLSEPIHVSDDDISRRLLTKSAFNKRQRQQRRTNENYQSSTCTTSAISVKFSTQQSPSMIGPDIKLASSNGTKLVFSYIYIEPIDYDEIDLNSVYRDSMIILYNLGVAHFAVGQRLESQQSSPSLSMSRLNINNNNNNNNTAHQQPQLPLSELQRWAIARELHQSAYQIFQLIEIYVRQALWNEVGTSSDNIVLLFSATFIHTMSELAYHLHYTAVQEYYAVAYTAILILIDTQEKSLPPMIVQAAAA